MRLLQTSDDDDDDDQFIQGAQDFAENNIAIGNKSADTDPVLDAIRKKQQTEEYASEKILNPIQNGQNTWEKQDLKDRYIKGSQKIIIASVFPRGGPLEGRTQVTVRAEGLEQLVDIFPDPKCKFGSNSRIVEADYVKCSRKPPSYYDLYRDTEKNETCVQCEGAPKKDSAEIVSFTVSLTGKFDDVYSSMPYRYYNQLQVSAIYPRYGMKDGDTVVQVWGKNFLDLGDDFRCSFGTKSTKAYYINDNYIWCRSAPSDVTGRPMPFSVSLNRQQNSDEKVNFWYYPDHTLTKITPDYGTMAGGTKVTLRGNGFKPFDWKLDINNQNDTYCSWGPLGKTPAIAISSTEAECLSPPNNMHLDWVPVNLTLNNQFYTDENIKFLFFNPPKVLDAEPSKGPVRGGTEIHIWGTQYEKRRNITCLFNDQVVFATYISKTHITCVSPQVQEAGQVKLVVKYQNDRFQSDTMLFEYFANPEVLSLTPSCGPNEGGTSITVKGKNFVEFGFGQARCYFNGTNPMNATVINSETLVCDSVPLDMSNGELQWTEVSVSLDGGEYISISSLKFKYYDQPTISSVYPQFGPLKGGTNTSVQGTGFNSTNICKFTVRFGSTHLTLAQQQNMTQVYVDSPQAKIPGAVVVSISGNGQQFINDKTLHLRDVENTFEYHQDFIIQSVEPTYISNSGNTPVLVLGMLFDQFKNDDGTLKEVKLLCRYVDSTAKVIGKPASMIFKSGNQQICVAPKTDVIGDIKIQLSVNGVQWQDIDIPLKFYNGPKVVSVNPTYGVPKNPKNLSLEITGENFACPNGDCSQIKVRFTNENKDQIVMDGKLSESGSIVCPIPKYPAPETLDVDVSFNDKDYSNNGVKFGFLDPFIFGIKPRLISSKGTTRLELTGFGFVQMEDAKSVVLMKSESEALQCQGLLCDKVYKVINQNLAQVDTFDQAQMMKEKGQKNIGYEPFTVNMMNPDGDFIPNDISLWFYKDPVFDTISSQFAYSNEEKPIQVITNFFWGAGNNYDSFARHAAFTCRFTSQNDPSKTVVTEAIMETSVIGQFKKDRLPDQIRCRTPKWDLVDVANLEFSVNGQDYIGGYPITFGEKLEIYKISPMSGPIGGQTKIKLYGQGLTSSKDAPLYIKFGTIEAQNVQRADIQEVTWSDNEYHNELNIPKSSLQQAEKNDVALEEGQILKSYASALAPDVSRSYIYDSLDINNMGGPVYVQVGEHVAINKIEHDPNLEGYQNKTTYNIPLVYSDSSSLEYYYYRVPIVTKVEPTSGLTSGGTVIDLTGAWFQNLPQYGVIPFCKIGSHVVKATFKQTNRIYCKTPPTEDFAVPSPISVSLNGVDFHETEFAFSYYQKPEIIDLYPRSGSIEGGTEIWLKGSKFSNITHGLKNVRCRFTQSKNIESNVTLDDEDAVVKYIPAYYMDASTMKCATPAGWVGGDQVKVDLTFNGVDYTEKSFIFSFYNIFGSFPKSGPSDAYTQLIQIRGRGFKEDSKVKCVLNNTEYEPAVVKANVIKCPMVSESWPSTSYESVNFHVSIDGSKHDFGNFHYYKQPTLKEVMPLIGPQEGKGAIYFIGRDFSDDFENARLACRIGNVLGRAQLVDSETVRCEISNKLPLVDEGQSLKVTLALNSYSWLESSYSFSPYGIYDIYPNSGPISENTNILVLGKGFNNQMKEFARCKFGTDENYVIVEAQVLDDEHLICKSPVEKLPLPEEADETISVPFSVAFQEDIYYPWTEGPQKFRLYKHPKLDDIYPSEVQIGKLSQVYIIADESEGFWQQIPNSNGQENDQYGLKCKFGRFGQSAATYINKTTILCLTPNIQDDPNDISEESVQVTVAMNGIDFNDYDSNINLIFVGTGGTVSTWVIIMGTLIFGLLIVSVLIFLGGLQDFMKQKGKENLPRNSYTQPAERGLVVPRVNSRASSNILGRRSAYPASRQEQFGNNNFI